MKKESKKFDVTINYQVPGKEEMYIEIETTEEEFDRDLREVIRRFNEVVAEVIRRFNNDR